MGTKKVDIANIDITGISVGANATYVAANARFEWISGTYTPSGPGSSPPAQGSSFGYIAGGSFGSNPTYPRLVRIECC